MDKPKIKLRPPTKDERLKGLPKTKNEAILRRLTRFIPEDGVERIIRNYGSKAAPSGNVTRAWRRHLNRGGGSSGSRKQNEAFATPPGVDKALFSRAVTHFNSIGLEADHIYEIARTANGIRFIEETGRGTREQFFKQFLDAGIYLGNDERNLQGLDPETHRQKNLDYMTLDQALQNLEQKYSFSQFSIPGLGFLENAVHKLDIAKDLFTFGNDQSNLDMVNNVANAELEGHKVFDMPINGVAVGRNDPNTDIGKNLGEKLGKQISDSVNNASNGIKKALKNGSKAVDTNGISTI